jgi:hypothetical protein
MQPKPGSTYSRRANWGPGERAGGVLSAGAALGFALGSCIPDLLGRDLGDVVVAPFHQYRPSGDSWLIWPDTIGALGTGAHGLYAGSGQAHVPPSSGQAVCESGRRRSGEEQRLTFGPIRKIC